jgi:CBS domain-containing protein
LLVQRRQVQSVRAPRNVSVCLVFRQPPFAWSGGIAYPPRRMAALDPVAYLRATPPFHALPKPLFDEAARALEVGYYPAGSLMVRVDDAPLAHLYVIRKGSVRLEREGQVMQVLEEGETFGYTSLLTGKATLDVMVEDDLLAYRLPAAEFRHLLTDAQFAGHFAAGLSQRLKSSLEHSPVTTFKADLHLEVQTLLRRPAVWVEADATVGQAAKVMRDENVSSVLVRSDPPGIVTDRDFRNRVLAAGLGPETPVLDVLSRPLRLVDAATPISAAWTALLDSGGHHLPVRRGELIAGVLTSTDLLKTHAPGPVAILRRVERMTGRDSLPGYGTKVMEMASALLAGGLQADVIAGYVARLNDTLVRRVLAFAEADLGAPPAPYAWIAMGSEGRMEQTLLTDQDNALVYAEEGEPHRAWFQTLATRVNADLVSAGFPVCTGGYMASKWHGTVSEWVQRFATFFEARKPQEMLEASLFFDFRRVAGTLDFEPLEQALTHTAQHPVFLRYLARSALDLRPPGSLKLRLRESTEVDLKLQGLSPIVALARCYAMEVGSPAFSTRDRLEAALKAGLMSQDVFNTVSEAHRFLLGLRLRLQLKAMSEGKPVVNKLAFSSLSAIERSRLKDSFRAIKAWQDMAAYHYQVGF